MERRPCRRKKKKRKKTCTYDLDQPKRWHMQRRKRASSPVASVASWFDHHHHHWPHHQKAPSLPPALTTTRCYPPSVSFPIVVVVVFEKTFSPPLTSLAIIRPRFPPSASLPFAPSLSVIHIGSLAKEKRRATFCERLIVTWMISCVREVDGWGGSNWCCSKRKDGRIDLLEIGVIVSLIIIFHRVCYVHYFYLFYPFVLDFTKDNIGDKILQVLLHNNSKKK